MYIHPSIHTHTHTYTQLRVADTSMMSIEADSKSDPQQVTLRAITEGSRMCTAASCTPLPSGLPPGSTLRQLAVTANMSDYLFTWKPVRGQEMHEAYRMCLAASDQGLYTTKLVCYNIKVLYVI